MKLLMALVIANIVLGGAAVVLCCASLVKKQQAEIVAEHHIQPSEEYVRRVSESFVVGLETVNPSSAERADFVLSCVSGELYQKLKETLSKRNEMIQSTEGAQWIRITNSECRMSNDARANVSVEGEKTIAFGEGVTYRAKTLYKLVWIVSPPSTVNPLGLTLVGFDSEEQYENSK